MSQSRKKIRTPTKSGGNSSPIFKRSSTSESNSKVPSLKIQPSSHNDSKKHSIVNRSISTFFGIASIFILVVSILIADYRIYHSYPNVTEKCQLQSAFPASNMFCEKEALEYVKFLSVDVGNRLIGSKELERSEEYIFNVIRDIMSKSKLNRKVDVELQYQKATGNFLLEQFLGKDLIQAYHNISNIIVRINPNGSGKFVEHETVYTTSYIDHVKGNRNALLLNAHYDSAVGSPGATDDGVPVGVMLALLRNLVTTPTELKAPVILLFNGGEEFGMHAAHGFISQHKWAQDIRTIINLESCGGGQGRPMLFQAGPGHGYAVKSYQSVSPYAQASVMAQDMIKFLPADTDYRVFTKHTNYFAAGMDLAFTRNGYVYHSSEDSYAQIQPGAVQHMGETVFNLVHDLTSNYLSEENVSNLNEEYEPLFIDLLGLKLLVWDLSHQSIAVATLIVVLAILFTTRLAQNWRYKNSISFVNSVVVHFVGLILSFLGSIAVSLLVSLLIIHREKTLAWYVSNWVGIAMYGSITVMVTLAINYGCNSYIRKITSSFAFYSNRSVYEIAEEAQVWALEVLLLLLTILLQLIGMRTSIVFFGYSVVFAISLIVSMFFPISVFARGVMVIAPLSAYQLYATMLMLDAGWPFFGRLGAILNGELLCSVYITSFTLLNILYILPSIQNVRKFYILSYVSGIIATLVFVFILQNNVYFSADRPRRFAINHVRYVNPETGVVDKNYVHFGLLDSHQFATSFDPLVKLNPDLTWSESSPILNRRDFSAAYPLSNVVRGATINLYNGTEVGSPSPIHPKVKVLEDQVSRVEGNVWNRVVRLHVNCDVKGLGAFTTIVVQSPLVHAWSFNGDIRRDVENEDGIFIKLVGDGEVEFSVHLRDTIPDSTTNVKEHLVLPLRVDVAISKRDKILDKIHAMITPEMSLSEMVIQQFNTEWRL